MCAVEKRATRQGLLTAILSSWLWRTRVVLSLAARADIYLSRGGLFEVPISCQKRKLESFLLPKILCRSPLYLLRSESYRPFLESTYWFYIQGFSRGSRGGSGILKKQTPFRTPSDGSGSVQQLRKGVKNFVRLKTLSSTPFFERIPIPPPKKSMRHNFVEGGMKFISYLSDMMEI